MKKLAIYREALGCESADDVFRYLTKHLCDSITVWDYFVNWEKVTSNCQSLEVDLNTLNVLIGKEDVETHFKELLRQRPSIVRLIPVLLACRDTDFKILLDFGNGHLKYEEFSFLHEGSLSAEEIRAACRFASMTGLLKLFKDRRIKSVPDYVLGVEVGLDSNGRKNRHGVQMEEIVEGQLKAICNQSGIQYLRQAKARQIRENWNFDVHLDKAGRSFDFAVKSGKKLFLIETNYYGGGGSKLKSTAGEYRDLASLLTQQDHGFIWITDGLGWVSTVGPLRDTFDKIDYTLNLSMVTQGVLKAILLA